MFEVVICRNLKPIKQKWQKFYGMVSEILMVLRLCVVLIQLSIMVTSLLLYASELVM
jgi:hypothetical protein